MGSVEISWRGAPTDKGVTERLAEKEIHMKFLGMGVPELVIILVVVLLIFGPKNLPKLGSAICKTVKGLRDGMSDKGDEVEETVVEEVVEEPKAAPKKKVVKKVVASTDETATE